MNSLLTRSVSGLQFIIPFSLKKAPLLKVVLSQCILYAILTTVQAALLRQLLSMMEKSDTRKGHDHVIFVTAFDDRIVSD